MTGDALNLLIAAVTLVASVVVSYLFYRLTKKERRPVYVVTGNTVVRAHPEQEIEVHYKGLPVPVVTRTLVIFWNAGHESIRLSDVVENHPLRIKLLDDSVVLDAQILATTRSEIDFTCLVDDNRTDIVAVSFSHLNYCDGATVEILHTGNNPSDAKVEGAIIGVNGTPICISSPLWDDPAGYKLPFLLSIGFLAFGIIGYWVRRDSFYVIYGFAALAMVLIGSRSWRRDRRRLPRPLQHSLSRG